MPATVCLVETYYYHNAMQPTISTAIAVQFHIRMNERRNDAGSGSQTAMVLLYSVFVKLSNMNESMPD